MNKALLYLMVVASALSASCSFSAPSQPQTIDFTTIVDATIYTIGCNPPKASLHIGVQKPFHSGTMVVYRAECPADGASSNASPIIGYAFLTQQGKRWQAFGGSAFDTRPMPADHLVDVSSSTGHAGDSSKTYSIVFGYIITAHPKVQEIKRIEVVFNDGIALSDNPQQGLFAVVADGFKRPCTLRVIGLHEEILQDRNLHPTEPCR